MVSEAAQESQPLGSAVRRLPPFRFGTDVGESPVVGKRVAGLTRDAGVVARHLQLGRKAVIDGVQLDEDRVVEDVVVPEPSERAAGPEESGDFRNTDGRIKPLPRLTARDQTESAATIIPVLEACDLDSNAMASGDSRHILIRLNRSDVQTASLKQHSHLPCATPNVKGVKRAAASSQEVDDGRRVARSKLVVQLRNRPEEPRTISVIVMALKRHRTDCATTGGVSTSAQRHSRLSRRVRLMRRVRRVRPDRR